MTDLGQCWAPYCLVHFNRQTALGLGCRWPLDWATYANILFHGEFSMAGKISVVGTEMSVGRMPQMVYLGSIVKNFQMGTKTFLNGNTFSGFKEWKFSVKFSYFSPSQSTSHLVTLPSKELKMAANSRNIRSAVVLYFIRIWKLAVSFSQCVSFSIVH